MDAMCGEGMKQKFHTDTWWRLGNVKISGSTIYQDQTVEAGAVAVSI